MRKVILFGLLLSGLLLVSASAFAGTEPTKAHASVQPQSTVSSPLPKALEEARSFVIKILHSFQFQIGAHIGIVPTRPLFEQPTTNDTPVKSSTDQRKKPWQEDVLLDHGGDAIV